MFEGMEQGCPREFSVGIGFCSSGWIKYRER